MSEKTISIVLCVIGIAAYVLMRGLIAAAIGGR